MSSLKYTTGRTRIFINPQEIQNQINAYNRKKVDVNSMLSILGGLGVIIYTMYSTQQFFEPKKSPQIDSEEHDGSDDDDDDKGDGDGKENHNKSVHVSISNLGGQDDEPLDAEHSAAIAETNRAHNDADDESNFGLARFAEVLQEQRQGVEPDTSVVEEDIAEEKDGSYFEGDEASQVIATYFKGIPDEEMENLLSRLRNFLPDTPSHQENEEGLAYNQGNNGYQRGDGAMHEENLVESRDYAKNYNYSHSRAEGIFDVYNAADFYGEGPFVEIPLTPENTPNGMANYSYGGEQEVYSPQSPGWHYVEYHIGDRCA